MNIIKHKNMINYYCYPKLSCISIYTMLKFMPTVAAKYMQVENEMQLIMDMELASVLPYFKKAAPDKK